MSSSGAPAPERHESFAARYDALLAGARCAGAACAMLLARQGLRVLVVDPAPRGRDTLSTHALMRGAVMQLRRWGLLDAVRASGAPPIHRTAFHYGNDVVDIPIQPGDGIDALYAPRRTVLDPLLADAARAAGADVRHGHAVAELRRDGDGRVRGARLRDAEGSTREVTADLLIGADGVRSAVARLVDAPWDYRAPHTSASIYGYARVPDLEGYHWYFAPGASVGSIPTNGGETCVFASLPEARFARARRRGLPRLYQDLLDAVSPDFARRVGAHGGPGRLRAFAGTRGGLRRAAGPGWALVGDAGYFRDPITAHGITDALREAECLARAVVAGTLADYQAARDARVRGLLDVSDQIAAFGWDLDTVRDDHVRLAREMKALVAAVRDLDRSPGPTSPPNPPRPAP